MEADTRGEQARAISQATVQITRAYTGRGPTKARTYINDDLITVVMQDTLTRGELALVEGGAHDRVVGMRHEFQRMMGAELTAAVELETGRTVRAFMSANHVDPDIATETFVLTPIESTR